MHLIDDNTAQPFSRLAPWVSFTALMFLITYLDRAVFGPLLPYLEEEFAVTHAASTRLLFYLSVGYSLSLFVSGFTSAKVRPRVMVSGAVILCGLMMLLLSQVHNLMLFTVLICCVGVAAGHYFNGGLSTLRSIVAPSQWSMAISIHEIGPNAGFILAPFLAEFGSRSFGWRGITAGMGVFTVFVGAAFFFFAKGGETPAARVSFRGLGEYLKDSTLWVFTWLMALAVAGEFGPYSVLTLHMMDDRGISKEQAAFLLSVSRLASPAAVLCGGWITERLGTYKTLTLCIIGYALGMFLTAAEWMPAFYLGLFTQPVLTAMIFPPVFNFLAGSYPHKVQPMLLAVSMPIASFIGVGVVPPLLGICGDMASFNLGFMLMGCMVTLSLPLLFFMARAQKAGAFHG